MDFARRVKRSFLAGRSLDAESRRTLSAGRGRAVDVRAPGRVARFFVQKSFGCFDGAEERGLRRAGEKGGDVGGTWALETAEGGGSRFRATIGDDARSE